jgi:hypothetical protein
MYRIRTPPNHSPQVYVITIIQLHSQNHIKIIPGHPCIYCNLIIFRVSSVCNDILMLNPSAASGYGVTTPEFERKADLWATVIITMRMENG